jgi:hypothetical protein
MLIQFNKTGRQALILFSFGLISISGICQKTAHEKIKKRYPISFSLNLMPGLTKLSPFPSIFSYDMGLGFGFFLKDNIWTSAGINYSHKGFKQDPMNIYAKTNPGKVTGEMNYLEFPVSWHYRSGDFSRVSKEVKKRDGHVGKVGFTGSAGIIPGLLYDGKYYIPTNGNAIIDHQIYHRILKNAGYKSIVSVLISAGFYYHISHRFFMTVEPEIKYSLSQVPCGTRYNWSTVGFRLSLWCRIVPDFVK